MALPLLSAGPAVLAAEATGPAAPATPGPAPDFAAGLGQMAFGLAVVIALLFGCLWAIKRLSAPRGTAGAAMKVLGAVAVGPRERVVLVRLGDKVLVLGVAPGNVQTLHVMDTDELPAPGGSVAPGSGDKNFPGWLRQAMERRNAP